LLNSFKIRLALVENDQTSKIPALRKKDREWADDSCLCRYLRARDWNIDLAETMIRSTLVWRLDHKPYKITAQEIEPEARQAKMYLHVDYDKLGRPIVYMKPGLDTGTDRVLKVKYLVWILEQAIKAMDTSKGVEKMVWIADFTGTGFRQSSYGNIQLSIECLYTFCDHYPERLGAALLINCPWIFGAFWKCISPLINPVTLAKIKVFQADYVDTLLEIVDKEVLERDFGGENDYKYDHDEWMRQWNVTPPDKEDQDE